MHVAFDAFQRVKYPAPFVEGHYRGKAACVANVRIGSSVEPEAHDFVAYLHRAMSVPDRLRMETACRRQIVVEVSRKRVSTSLDLSLR